MPAPTPVPVRVPKKSTNRPSSSRTSGTRSSAYPRPRRGLKIRTSRKRRTRTTS